MQNLETPDTRKCRNWQTSKTKDLVVVTSCGFKSHLPHERLRSKDLSLFCIIKKLATDAENLGDWRDDTKAVEPRSECVF